MDRNEGGEPPAARIRPNAFAKLGFFSVSNCISVLTLLLAAAAMALVYAAVELDVDLSRNPAIAIEPEIAAAQAQLDRAFPGIDQTIFAEIAAGDPSLAREAALAAGRQLLGSRLFGKVFVPGTGPFYETYRFLFLDLADIEARVAQALGMLPLFQALAASPDLAGLAALTNGIARSIEQGHSPAGVAGLLRAAAVTVEAEGEGRPRPLRWLELAGLDVAPASTRWFLLAEPAPGKLERAMQAARALRLDGASVKWTFPPAAAVVRASFVRAYGVPAGIAVLLVLAVLTAAIGGPGRFFAILLAAGITVSITAGAAALIAPVLNTATWAFPWAAAAPAIMFAVIVALTEAEARARGLRPTAAIVIATQLRGAPVLATAAMTLALWLAWLPGALPAMGQLAALMVIATVVAVLCALMAVPAALAVFGRPSENPSPHWLDLAIATPAPYHARQFRQVLALMLIAAAVFCSVFVPNMKFGDSAAASVAGAALDTPVATGAVHLLSKPDAAAHRLIARLGELPETGAIRWIEQFLPAGIAAKRKSLQALSGFEWHLPEARLAGLGLTDAVNDLQAGLFAIANDARADAELRAAAQALRRSLSRVPPASSVAALEAALFSGFNDLGEEARALAQLAEPELATLDENIRRRFVADDGTWRIEVLPKPGVTPLAFAAALRDLGANGPPVLALARSESYRKAAVLAILPGFVMASVIALVVLRRLGDWLAVVVPPMMMMSLSAAVLAGLGMTLAPAGLLALTIASALSLCGTLLLALRFRHALHDPSSTGFRTAVTPAVLCLAAAAPLSLSDSQPIAEFGAASAIFLGTAALINLIAAPQLFIWLRRLGH